MADEVSEGDVFVEFDSFVPAINGLLETNSYSATFERPLLGFLPKPCDDEMMPSPCPVWPIAAASIASAFWKFSLFMMRLRLSKLARRVACAGLTRRFAIIAIDGLGFLGVTPGILLGRGRTLYPPDSD